MPRDKVVLICTGSQGEPRAALTRIAEDSHPAISLDEGDHVVFSSREIPGNERAIGRLQNRLAMLGVSVITARDEDIHVSGHPNRDELAQMYHWVRPRIAVPTHGEARHLRAHADLARSCQIPHVLVARNGDLIRLSETDGPEVIDEVYAGRLALDGKRLTAFESEAIKGRRRLSFNGSVVVTAVVDKKGRLLQDPQVSAPGLAADNADELIDDLLDAVEDAVEAVEGRKGMDDDALAEVIRRAARRAAQDSTGKRPPTEVHLVRI
jgi:ribonuclease J